MSRAKTMISKKKAPVRYYDYSEQFHRDEYVESDARSTISSGVHQAHAIPEEHKPTDVATSRDDRNETYTSETSNIEDLPASPVAPRVTNDPKKQGVGILTRGDTKSLIESMDISRNVEFTRPDGFLNKKQSVPHQHVMEAGHPGERENNGGTTSLQNDLSLYTREPSSGERSSHSFNIPSRSSEPATSTSPKHGKESKSSSSINQEEYPIDPYPPSSPAVQVAAVSPLSEATTALRTEEPPIARRVRFLILQQIDSHSVVGETPNPTLSQQNPDSTSSRTQSHPPVYSPSPRDHITCSSTTRRRESGMSDGEPTSHAAWYGHAAPTSVPLTGVQGDAATRLPSRYRRSSSDNDIDTAFPPITQLASSATQPTPSVQPRCAFTPLPFQLRRLPRRQQVGSISE
ncbi:hypothetical protein PSV08DRAFT_360089 [Bipolaris maydis]|uniref:uncharacterized protein n=1 Tax=Cochliobolus heterostrophus TaxID=5016 RepID=UPI0024D8B5E5|nr:hypothetical protein PSV08DRAFT_360089 [Bipolaris maydis]